MKVSRDTRIVPRNLNHLVRFMFEEAIRQDCSYEDLAKRAGVSRPTITNWRRRTSPSLHNFEACINALGFEMRITRKKTLGEGDKK